MIWVLLDIVGIILLGLLTLVLVLLFVPFGLAIEAAKNDADARVDARILVANVRLFTYRIWPARRSKKARSAKKRVKRERARDTGRPSPAGRILPRLSIDLVAPVAKLLVRLWKSLRLSVSFSGTFGAADPASTGIIYGAYESVARPLNIRESLQPCFDRPCLEGRIEVSGRIWLIELLTDAVLFLFSRPIREVWFPELRYMMLRR